VYGLAEPETIVTAGVDEIVYRLPQGFKYIDKHPFGGPLAVAASIFIFIICNRASTGR
jgi:hypothetical protein